MKKNAAIFFIFGSLYCLIEILFRGYTYPSMLIVGGVCGLLVGLINEYTPEINLILQMLLGTVIVTFIEFVAGSGAEVEAELIEALPDAFIEAPYPAFSTAAIIS